MKLRNVNVKLWPTIKSSDNLIKICCRKQTRRDTAIDDAYTLRIYSVHKYTKLT
jgi:hypothetical protein